MMSSFPAIASALAILCATGVAASQSTPSQREGAADLERARVTAEARDARRLTRPSLRLLEHRRAPMDGGMEPEPVLYGEVRRELFELVADITGERALARYRGTPKPHTSRLRGIAATEDVDRAQRRATWVEIEEFDGPDETTTSTANALAGGFSLICAGAILDALDPNVAASRSGIDVRPLAWPAGIRIKGQFSLP